MFNWFHGNSESVVRKKSNSEVTGQRFLLFGDQVSQLCNEFQREVPLGYLEKEDETRIDNLIATTYFGKWCMDILIALRAFGPARFEVIRKNSAGITAKVLSRKLAFLEMKSLIKRTIVDAHPPGTSYQLTKNGIALLKLSEPVMLYLRHLEGQHQTKESTRW
jgi:DNA-binding HxlR family transcriptional regulator